MKQVAAAVIIEDGCMLLARRGPAGPLAGYWELPGGKVELGETLRECLTRELLEELEMQSAVGEVIATTTYSYEHGCFEMLALEATRRSHFELRVHDAVSWVSRNEIGDINLAPADVELIAQIIAAGHW